MKAKFLMPTFGIAFLLVANKSSAVTEYLADIPNGAVSSCIACHVNAFPVGHNSKAVHHTYSKHAEVTVPSLDDWEKEWQKHPQHITPPKLVPVDFRPPAGAVAQAN